MTGRTKLPDTVSATLEATTGRRQLLGVGLGAAGGAVALTGLAGSPAVAAANNAEFWCYGPQRVADTRTGTRIQAGKMVGGQTRTVALGDFFLAGYSITAIVNVTVLSTAGRGTLTVWENGTGRPGVFSAVWAGEDQAVSNVVITGLQSTDVSFNIHCAGKKAKAHVVVDLFGYFFHDGAALARPQAERGQ